MAENWPAVVGFLVLVFIICLAAHRQNRDAEKQGGRNPVQFRFRFGRNSFEKAPEELYTQDRKINREWKR